jgi:hypothetical protein
MIPSAVLPAIHRSSMSNVLWDLHVEDLWTVQITTPLLTAPIFGVPDNQDWLPKQQLVNFVR